MKTEETRELEKLLGIEPEETEQEIPIITKYEDAENVMNTYAAANDRILERTVFVRDRVALVMQRLEQLNAEDEKKKKAASELLKGWGQKFIKQTKQKTVKLMRGEISFSDIPEAVVVDDEKKAVDHILKLREDKQIIAKQGTVPLKIEIKFKEHDDPEAIARVRQATEKFIDSIITDVSAGPHDEYQVDPEVKVGQREIAAFYKKTGLILDGTHVRPKLQNANFKIKSIAGEISAQGQGEINGGEK